jgi:hypothetical protein
MGFAKSIKSLFKGKKGAKDKEDSFNPYEPSQQKASVGRNKVQLRYFADKLFQAGRTNYKN